MTNEKKSGISVSDMVLCALFAALIAVGAFIRVPLGAVPMTLQFLFTNLAGLLLGKKLGAYSVLLYIFIGLIGIPVFTQGGGPGYVLLPSFGYLPGMALGAWLAGLVYERGSGSFKSGIMAGLANMAVTYLLGLAYYAAIKVFYLSDNISLWNLLLGCCLVFVPGDAISCVMGALLAKRLKPVLQRLRLKT